MCSGSGENLSQASYITKLMDTYAPNGKPLCPYGFSYPLKSHPSSRVPAASDLPQLVLNATTGQEASDVEPNLKRAYQRLVGAPLYTSVNTRPEVAYAVSMLCRAMGKPTPALYSADMRVLYYLHRHRHIGLQYGVCELDLSGMSDADWAIKHSTSGWVSQYSQAAISWATN